jgi:hypothetical protein
VFVLAFRRNTLLDWSTTELEFKDLRFTVSKTQISKISHGLVVHTEIQYCNMYPTMMQPSGLRRKKNVTLKCIVIHKSSVEMGSLLLGIQLVVRLSPVSSMRVPICSPLSALEMLPGLLRLKTTTAPSKQCQMLG